MIIQYKVGNDEAHMGEEYQTFPLKTDNGLQFGFATINQVKTIMNDLHEYRSLLFNTIVNTPCSIAKPTLQINDELGVMEFIVDDNGMLHNNIVTQIFIDKSVYLSEEDIVFQIVGNFVLAGVGKEYNCEYDESGDILHEWDDEINTSLTHDQRMKFFTNMEEGKIKIIPFRYHNPDTYDFSKAVKIIPLDF